MKKFFVLAIILIILVLPFMISNGDDEHHDDEENHDEPHEESFDFLQPIPLIIISSIISGITILVSLVLRRNVEEFRKYKKLLFIIIIIPIIFTSLFMFWDTISENSQSVTGGPVHWHADFEIYLCDEGIDIIDPSRTSNKIGTSVFHEHNDFRIHIEGTVLSYEEINLPSFFEVIGGELTEESIKVLTNEGVKQARNGDLCNDQESVLNVFVYELNKDIVTQRKIEDIHSYVYSPESLVPPGDCIIIEFGPEKESTEKICKTYEIEIEKGEIIYGG